MACNNGKTFLDSLVPYTGGESFLINLTHYTCGGRRICSLESFPVTANLSYKVVSSEELGKGLFDLTVLATGTVTYMPYNPGCPCGVCPVTEPIYAYLSVPYTGTDIPTIEAESAVCSLNGISCACNTSSSINIAAAFTLPSVSPTSGAGDGVNPSVETRKAK